MTTSDPAVTLWRTSSFSGNNGTCVAVATLPSGYIAVRNSNHPEEGTVLFTRAEMNAWIQGVKAGEFDDFT
ncbi:MAG: DUF397 domain-containing protein [Actinomycetota bacterium]|nr:DUF397 domain-containing protein [Actinomycetota bacterium]MDQ3904924.1 DUF397 domain-containing protein [Actinomycetota bacterium]